MDIETTDLTLDTTAGPAAAHLAAPASGAGPAVLVLHPWWGLNADVVTWADELAAAGFTAMAPDLFDGTVLDTVDDAQAHLGTVDKERCRAVVAAARDELLARSGAASYGVVAASFGAGFAGELAEADGEAVTAVVLYYGVTEADWSRVRARVLHHFGDRDQMDPVSEADGMQAAMTAGGVAATLELYPGADHWFAEPGRPEHHPDHAAAAWERTVGWLRG